MWTIQWRVWEAAWRSQTTTSLAPRAGLHFVALAVLALYQPWLPPSHTHRAATAKVLDR